MINLAAPSLSARLSQVKRLVVQPVIWFGCVLLCVIWAAIWLQLRTERQSAQRDIAQETANIALIFEQNVQRTATDIDRMLKFIRQSYERSGFEASWPSLIQEEYTVNDQTVQIAVIDAKGMMITSTAALHPPKPLDLSDREHYRVHAVTDEDNLFISKPVIGRASGKWSVQFTRRFFTPEGKFGGVLVVSLDPQHLSTAYGGLALGKRGGLAVIGSDDRVRAGSGIYEGMLGNLLEDQIPNGTSSLTENGTQIVVGEVDGEIRSLAARPVKGFPLRLVVAGRRLQDDNTWQKNSKNYVSGGIVLSLLVMLAAFGALNNRRRHELQLVHLARHDALTGLPNRVQLGEEIDRAFNRCTIDQTFALHLIDLDGFKFVNDTYGHPCGDKLLKAVGERLRANLRHIDAVARLGGDEFAVLQTCLETDNRKCADLAKWMCDVLNEAFDIDGIRITIGASIGIALGRKDAQNAADLVKTADIALYTAKADGRGTYRFYSEEMNASAMARRSMEADLRLALDAEQLELHYQPIMEMDSQTVAGYEALLRWHHPERGNIPPADFIGLAEETGLIVKIGAWVLHKACMDMANCPEHLRVAVNIAPTQFRSATLIDTVKSALAASGLSPSRLEVEITETTLMQKDSTTIGQLQELQALGIRIAMDDFGTGYSSLSYLQSYPISSIKIDRSFVSLLGEKESSSAIIRAITSLAMSLGMSTVAEGVETQEQLDELLQLGCSEAQGFYFSRPKPANQILPNIGETVDVPAEAAEIISTMEDEALAA